MCMCEREREIERERERELCQERTEYNHVATHCKVTPLPPFVMSLPIIESGPRLMVL